MRSRGAKAEKRAVEYLKNNKYIIIDTNSRNSAGEVDIIALDKDYLVFVEVKARTTKLFGRGAESVNYYKQLRYFNFAKIYTMQNKCADSNVRFDVIEIYQDKINHIISAFVAK